MESLTGKEIPDGGVVARKRKESVGVIFHDCPNCGRVVARAVIKTRGNREERWVWPSAPFRPVPKEVPEHVASQFTEAVAVLPISAKASAALSRRCLQTVLSEAGGARKTSLSEQIDETIPHLPSHLQESIDAIRNIGNFASHPMKSTSTGLILEVEIGEAEWNLDTLEELFDFYFVQPARIKTKRDALNRKLAEAHKPPMK